MARRTYDVNEEGSGGQRRGRRKASLKVCMLDDSVVKFDIEPKEKGDVLYKQVYEYLNLEECEYFGLHYYDKSDNMFWLDQHKPINKQINDIGKVLLRFSVKFYAPDPAMLQEEYTRYMFALQVKRDLLSGRLKCSESTAALLASYVVQGELGDFDSLTCRPGYLAEFQFFPEQNLDSEGKIAEFHKQHKGLSPSDCDYNLLDVARRLEMYGIILYPARDKDNVELDLAAANMGILVFQSGAKINTLSWAKIRKLSFKRKRFLIKLHPEIFGHYKDVVEFQMGSRDACKSFWKVAISTHAFFRQSQSQSPPKHRPKVFSRGSSYRFSGRTQKQIIESTMENSRQQPSFNRTQSLKTPNKNNTPRSSQSTARPYGGFGNTETRVVESTPVGPDDDEEPGSETPEKDLQIQGGLPLENGIDEMEDDSDHEQLHEHGPVIKVQSAENPDEDIPLKDLDHEPDMMRDESSVSSVSQPDLEWQEEVISEHPPQNDVKYMTPHEDDNRDIILPPGAVEIECKPQPRPPTPIEVDGIESPPPPPPPEEEEEEIASKEFKPVESAYDDDEQEEFPAPPMETLPSPPPELLRDSPDPDRMDEEPHTMPVVQTNGYHEQKTHESLQITCTSVVKVQNGEVTRHGKGSSSSRHSTDDDSEQRYGRDNVFEEQVSPMFRSDTEASPPASPTPTATLKSEQTLSKSGSGAAYTIAKELLNTERTYVKDLEVITISFREVVSPPGVLPDSSKNLLFSTIDPIYDFHCTFLAELEERMALWDERIAENAEPPTFGDLMLSNMKQIKRYVPHLKKHDQVMINLETATKKYKQFDTLYKEFETQKVCYLPLNAFLVKPSQRLLHYKFLLERIIKFCPSSNPDCQDLQASLEELASAVRDTDESMKKLENVQKLIELQRDLIGVDGLVQQGRDFIREGCLQRIARKGPQPRMFFLFSDLLLYTCKGVTVTNQFRVQGQIPLHTVKIEDIGPDLHGLYPFTITYSNKHMVVAAQSEEEKYKWLEDLNSVVRHAKEMATCSQCMYNRAHHMFKSPNGRNTKYFCEECYILVDEDEPIMDVLSGQTGTYLEHNKNFENGDNQYGDNRYKILPLPTPVTIHRSSTGDDGSDDEAASTSPVSSLDRRHAHSNTMSTRRVCWHRNTSISMSEHALSVRNHMSGDLLRKFKTGNRWQKLWVVFTNFCLFFYKTHQDDFPLASLPLIGYLVDLPTPADQIDKELVFKLQYKSHVYFFRADNEYSFYRWMEVISSATQSSTRSRIFSRMESNDP